MSIRTGGGTRKHTVSKRGGQRNRAGEEDRQHGQGDESEAERATEVGFQICLGGLVMSGTENWLHGRLDNYL